MAKQYKGFFNENTVEIKHNGKTYRVNKNEVKDVKAGLEKIAKKDK
ncbi:MAG: hypothetical protein AAF348_07515 [Bacteroidota bacterium]